MKLVSAVIPAFNAGNYIREAIESILSETYKTVEIIVVDDGSTDGTRAAVKKFSGSHVRYVYQENSGQAAARNTGTSLALGEYFSFLDADDLWVNDKLAKQIKVFEENPLLDSCFGQVEQFYSPEFEGKKESLNVQDGYLLGAMLIKREAFLRVGQFKTSLQMAETVEWFSRARDMGLKTFMLPEILYRRRIHGMNLGITKKESRQEYVHVIRASLDRKRNIRQQS